MWLECQLRAGAGFLLGERAGPPREESPPCSQCTAGCAILMTRLAGTAGAEGVLNFVSAAASAGVLALETLQLSPLLFF